MSSQPPTRKWSASDVPNLAGRTAIVTGANSGIGLPTAAVLAGRGAEVTMAVRDLAKGQAALAAIRAQDPQAADRIAIRELDLADLASVRAFAGAWSEGHPQGLDLLVNNAGVMALPRRMSADGYEMQFATNHLGHFALTGLLLPALVARPGSRVVTVSSQAHRMGSIDFDDLMGERSYSAWRAYGQSKLANLLFAAELQRRLDAAGMHVKSLAAHPGYSATNLQSAGPRMRGRGLEERFTALGNRLLAQPPEMGALPTLFAATAPELPGDSYIGPDGFLEQRGHPKIVSRSKAAADPVAAARLWEVSEALTGVRYPFD